MKLVKKILTISFWRSQQEYQSNAGQGQSLQVGSSGISPQNDVLSWELDQNLSFSPSYSLLRPNGSKLRYKRWRNKEKNLKYFLKLINIINTIFFNSFHLLWSSRRCSQWIETVENIVLIILISLRKYLTCYSWNNMVKEWNTCGGG